MTNPSFEARYQLLKCVAVADGIRTHNALEISSGRVVMVHLLDAAGPDEVDSLRAQLAMLTDPDKARVLELATLPAGFALVTEFLQGLTSFTGWLETRVPPTPSTGGVRAAEPNTQKSWQRPIEPPPPEVVKAEGEFTRLFGTPVVPPPAPTPAAPPVTAAVSPPVWPPVAAPVPVPTALPVRLPTAAPVLAPATPPARPPAAPPVPDTAAPPWLSPGPSGWPMVDPAPSLPAAAPAPKDPEPPRLVPGEFTELFQPRVAPAPRDVAPSPFAGPPPVAAPPRFGSRDAGMARPPADPGAISPFGAANVRSSPPPAASPPGFRDAGPPPRPLAASSPFAAQESTAPLDSASPFALPERAGPGSASPFGKEAAPPLPPVVTPSLSGAPPFGLSQSSRPGAISPLGEPGAASLPPVVAPPRFDPLRAGSPLSPVGTAAAPVEPAGAYTLFIQQSITPQAPVASAPKAAPIAPAARKRIPLGLIIALNVVLLLAVVLVVYFIFRPTPDTAATGEALPDVPKAMPKAPVAPKLPAVPKLP